jgi:hypothetical protein
MEGEQEAQKLIFEEETQVQILLKLLQNLVQLFQNHFRLTFLPKVNFF